MCILFRRICKKLSVAVASKILLDVYWHVSVTAKCIKKVQNLALSDQCYATDIDNEMSKSVLLAKEAWSWGRKARAALRLNGSGSIML